MSENENKIVKGWSSLDGGKTFSAKKAKPPIYKDTLPPGYYSIGFSPFTGLYFEGINLKSEDLVKAPGTKSDNIIKGIKTFWKRRALFEKYNFPYKRGVLMYGPPGCGKTSTISLLCQEVIAINGICLKFMKTKLLSSGLELIREQQEEVPILVIMEDLDQLLGYNNLSELLNMLDGVSSPIQNIIYLATTNNPEELHENIRNRPSRFDKRIFFGPPEATLRKHYLQSLLGKDKDIPIDVDHWVKETEGLSFAHLKELFVSNILFGNDFKKTLDELKSMGQVSDEEVIDSESMEAAEFQAQDLMDSESIEIGQN